MSQAAPKPAYFGSSPLSVIYRAMALGEDILDQLPDIIVTTDPDFIITGINQACQIIYGGPATDLIGKPFFEVVKFKTIGIENAEAIRKLKEEGLWNGDIIYYNDDQAYYNYEHKLVFNSCSSAVKDATGKIIAYTFISRNISERIRQELALAKAEDRYHTLIESLSEGVIMMNVNGIITTCNKRAEEILGVPHGELTGKLVASSYWNAVKEDGTEYPLDELPAIITLNTGKEINNAIMGITKSDGTVSWLTINCRPMYREGFTQPEAVVCSFTEITESRKANERYAYALKASSDAIWDMDVQSGAIYRSDNFTTLTGYTGAQIEATLEWFMKKIHPEDRYRVQSNVDFCMKSNLTNWQNTYRFKTADGSYRHFLDKAFAIYENGKLARVIGGIQDMTQSKKLELQLVQEQVQKQRAINKATIQAQELERNRIGRELHDNVNQLLISAKLNIGAAKSLKEDNTELLEKAAAYILMAVEEIRTLSKQLNSSVLTTLGIEKSMEDIAQTLVLNEITPRINFDTNVLKKLSNDQMLMLYRIIQEQTNNIIKYAECTEATYSLQKKEHNAELIISDNGKGFDKNKKQASGIGFINIFNRAHVYNGKAEIITSPGNGCTLQISIPLQQADAYYGKHQP
ncbi:MAG TPA: PAS domain S-box protein [Ferruginibacter sp.]|nr:PAS domain S-box protein [Ferruginibacter sp.]HMP19377.1 PAS domain S-box protein [Ferruginibacter sp.]